MTALELEKPWQDPEKYLDGRLTEALYEAELALKLLEAGVYWNAAGKAFRAFKALLSALAMEYRDIIARKYQE
ncbi:MAG: PaREP1 family protein [Thermoproteaceae archaeon]|nr:PaREP1 family protein [Thermoproteaceae archaeon]